MRGLAGCVALAVMLAAGPAAAEDAMEEPAATARPAATQTASATPAGEPGAVPPLAWPLQEQLPIPPPPPPITLVLKADLGAQRLTVVENGKTKYTWPISSGRRGYATRTGTFRPQWASRMWYSRQYEYAPMPHAIFFNRGTAFHGTGAVGMLGRPASHGCIRLAPRNAAQLYKLVHKHGYVQTRVVVHGGTKARGPAIARRSNAGRKAASARQAPRAGYRVSRYNTLPTSYWPF